MKKTIFGLLAVFILLGVGASYYAWERVKQYGTTKLALTQETIFTLPAGTGRQGLEDLLIKQKLIKKSRWFPWLLKAEPELAKFKAGTYRIPAGMDVRQLLQLLRSGKEAQFSVRFVEGTRLRDWLKILEATPYLKHTLKDKTQQQVAELLTSDSTDHAEGWLYPDTYMYTANTSDEAILKRANQRMVAALDEEWKGRDKGLPYKTPHEMLIMASIIEKETAVSEERGKVASVFVNRIRIGMRLQTDPTVIYGMGEDYNGNITRKDLETETLYNTYVINGLPPTPIAMPGRASLAAAAHPATTPYLYFVADGYGGHTFTTNLQSHNQAVREYLKIQRQKRGQ